MPLAKEVDRNVTACGWELYYTHIALAVNEWRAMYRRIVFYAAWVAASCIVNPMLYASQACETVVAVSYLNIEPDVEQDLNQQLQHNLNIELLKNLAQKAQLIIKIDPAQGQQALLEAHSGRVDLIVGVSATPTKDPLLDYLAPPYKQKTYRIWRRKAEQLALSQWPELAGLRGVGDLQAEPLSKFAQQAEQRHWPVHTVDNLDTAVKQVLEGDADYLLAEQQHLQRYLVEHDLLQDFEFIEPPVETKQLFLAIAKDSACNTAALRTKLSKALTELSRP